MMGDAAAAPGSSPIIKENFIFHYRRHDGDERD